MIRLNLTQATRGHENVFEENRKINDKGKKKEKKKEKDKKTKKPDEQMSLEMHTKVKCSDIGN